MQIIYRIKMQQSKDQKSVNEKKQQKKNRYEKIKKLGQGAYGAVIKVFDHETQSIRALKKIKFTHQDDGIPINAIRQITTLKQISHPNIVKLYDIHYNWQPNKLYLSLQYLEENLYEHMRRHQPLSPFAIKSYAFQILSALCYLHSRGIMHRDVKPQNIMINNQQQGIIKLCDFGQSKLVSLQKQKYSSDVATLWYRAPQILLGSQAYSFSSDIWAAACVIIEMIQGQPIFKSDCQIGQIFQIFKLTGTPKKQQFPKWHYLSSEFPCFKKRQLNLKNADQQAIDLLQKMLKLNPSQRLSAYQAKRHKFFQAYQ